MPRIRYKVTLEEPEWQMLKEITTRGRHSSQKVLNALILLKCDEGRFQDRKLTNQAIDDVLPVSLKKDRSGQAAISWNKAWRRCWTNVSPNAPTGGKHTGTLKRI